VLLSIGHGGFIDNFHGQFVRDGNTMAFMVDFLLPAIDNTNSDSYY
jgi:hypothetical protein